MYQEQEIELKMSEGLEQALKQLTADTFKRAYNADLDEVIKAAEQAKLSTAKLKAEQKAEAKRISKIIIKLYKKEMSIDQIADTVSMEIEEVETILKSKKLV